VTPLLSISDLVVRYRGNEHPAVDGVSFDVPERGSVALVGESGSGKSTTVLAAMRLLDQSATVTASSLTFAGSDLLAVRGRQLRELRRSSIAMVFQDPTANWNPTRKIGAQLLDGLHGDTRRRQREKLVEYMRRVGITDVDHRLGDYPHHFSGGMLQRAMLAGGLANKPSLLIADEPTSALDTNVQAELLALIDQLRAEDGLTLLLISHDLGVVARMATETIVLYAGRVVEKGATATLLRAPQHPYTKDLLAATPRLRGPRKVRSRVGLMGEPSRGGCAYANRCAFAIDRCRAESPSLRRLGGVEAACHLAPIVQVEAA
jgi:oligopeptide/dipeptide ABC transporter ATP-binding protein